MLPIMRSDIMLRYKNKCLIIDAKFYKNTLNNYYDTKRSIQLTCIKYLPT